MIIAGPTIALSMGERGLPARLLAPRYGALLTFGALAAGRESAPGADLSPPSLHTHPTSCRSLLLLLHKPDHYGMIASAEQIK